MVLQAHEVPSMTDRHIQWIAVACAVAALVIVVFDNAKPLWSL